MQQLKVASKTNYRVAFMLHSSYTEEGLSMSNRKHFFFWRIFLKSAFHTLFYYCTMSMQNRDIIRLCINSSSEVGLWRVQTEEEIEHFHFSLSDKHDSHLLLDKRKMYELFSCAPTRQWDIEKAF